MTVPHELVESFQRGDAILFVGAGLSIGAGLPGWLDLVRPLAESVDVTLPMSEDDLLPDHVLTVAQHYENRFGRRALVDHLRSALDTLNLHPTPVHRLAMSLPVRIVYTTNYDDLIERTLRDVGRHPNLIIDEEDLAFWREDRVQVIKLCGDRDRPESMLITQRDFNTYFTRRPRLVERLRVSLESGTPLFLGYSMQDPFFNQIWDIITLNFGPLRRWGYAVVFDADEQKADYLRFRNIHIINLVSRGIDRSRVLQEWLEELMGSLRQGS